MRPNQQRQLALSPGYLLLHRTDGAVETGELIWQRGLRTNGKPFRIKHSWSNPQWVSQLHDKSHCLWTKLSISPAGGGNLVLK